MATTVRVEVRPGFVEVWLNDVLRCTEPRGERQPFDNVAVYAADPWHTPADALINNFFIRELEPVSGCTQPTACNFNDHATVDDGSCVRAMPGQDCDNNALLLDQDKTYFLRPGVMIPLAQSAQHAVIDLPTDYEVSFDITPSSDLVGSWGNIIHLTATGNNCCAYGDRIPGLFRFPLRNRCSYSVPSILISACGPLSLSLSLSPSLSVCLV